jgi:hypothetical protein
LFAVKKWNDPGLRDKIQVVKPKNRCEVNPLWNANDVERQGRDFVKTREKEFREATHDSECQNQEFCEILAMVKSEEMELILKIPLGLYKERLKFQEERNVMKKIIWKIAFFISKEKISSYSN